MDWDRIKVNVFPLLVFAVIVMFMMNYAVTQDRFWYQNETFRSWEQQQSYSELLRQEINSYKDKVADLNAELRVCEVVLVYEKGRGVKE